MSKSKKTNEVHAVCRQSRIWLMDFRGQLNKMIDEKLQGIDVIEYVSTKQNGSRMVAPATDDGVDDAV